MYPLFGETCRFHIPGFLDPRRWDRKAAPKRRYIITTLRYVTSQKSSLQVSKYVDRSYENPNLRFCEVSSVWVRSVQCRWPELTEFRWRFEAVLLSDLKLGLLVMMPLECFSSSLPFAWCRYRSYLKLQAEGNWVWIQQRRCHQLVVRDCAHL
jgi:hypothetical protein